jgi:hypothetical protein
MTDTSTLITQLRVLAHLTRTEAQVARLRTTQATGDGARSELGRNAADADARAKRIAGALRELGALPDPVTPVLGQAAALVRGALEQAQPLDEALFGDLALEHQLHDRARHVGALADAAGLPAVRALADDLVAAHTETVEWLHGVLDDVAAGRRAALAASPLQRVAAQVTRTANTPARPALDEAGAAVSRGVGQTVGTVTQVGGAARAAVEETAQRAARAGADVASTAVTAGGGALAAGRDTAAQAVTVGQDAVAAGRDALTRTVEGVARLAGAAQPPAADDAPGATGTTTEATPDPAVAPIPGFAELSAQAAVASLRTLDRAAALAALAFEQAHGNRPAVVRAARIRAGAVRDE